MRSILYFLLFTILAAPLMAAPITYQGQLQQSGQLVDGTEVSLSFQLFATEAGDDSLGDAIPKVVTPQNGLFQVELDFGAGAFDGSPRFLEILVNGTPLGERQAVVATPQALIATTTVAGAIGTSQINATQVQRRVTENCQAGQYIQTVNEDGTVVCGSEPPGRHLGGNAGTDSAANFLGTTDNQALELRTANVRSLRIEPSAELFEDLPLTTNVIAGSRVNEVTPGVRGATISGGGAPAESRDLVGWAAPNRVTDHYGTVGGGFNNQAGDGAGSTSDSAFATVSGGIRNTASQYYSTIGGGVYNTASGGQSTVGGGYQNIASGNASTVGGGQDNRATGLWSTVPGGSGNRAAGVNSFAAGSSARADHDGTFVWNSDAQRQFVSTAENQFLINAIGGVGIGLTDPKAALQVRGTVIIGNSLNAAINSSNFVSGGGERSNDASGWDSFIGGGSNNSTNFHASFVGGGVSNHAINERSFVGGGDSNTASGINSFVGGGSNNTAVNVSSFIGGGRANRTNGALSFIGGGVRNRTEGDYSFVAGGQLNTAAANWSFAAGRQAQALHAGTFVWADSTNADVTSDRANQFKIRANGGAEFQTGVYGLVAFSDSAGTAGAALQGESVNPAGIGIYGRNNSTDATLVLNNGGTGRLIRAFNGGTILMNLENNGNLWIRGALTQNSDRDQKEDIQAVDAQMVLDRLSELQIDSWRYLNGDESVRHIGPMAQDFHAAFGFGVSETTISTIDAQGIAFAAIQALNQRLLASQAEVAVLKVQAGQMRELADRNADLEARLASLEALLLDDRQVAERLQ